MYFSEEKHIASLTLEVIFLEVFRKYQQNGILCTKTFPKIIIVVNAHSEN